MDKYINLYFDVCKDNKLTDEQKIANIETMIAITTGAKFNCNLNNESRYYKYLHEVYNDIQKEPIIEKIKIIGYLLSISTSEDPIIEIKKGDIYLAIVNHMFGNLGDALIFNSITFNQITKEYNPKAKKVDLGYFEKTLAKWGNPDLLNKYLDKFPEATSRIGNILEGTCAQESCLIPCDDMADVIMGITSQQLFGKSTPSNSNLVQ